MVSHLLWDLYPSGGDPQGDHESPGTFVFTTTALSVLLLPALQCFFGVRRGVERYKHTTLHSCRISHPQSPQIPPRTPARPPCVQRKGSVGPCGQCLTNRCITVSPRIGAAHNAALDHTTRQQFAVLARKGIRPRTGAMTWRGGSERRPHRTH